MFKKHIMDKIHLYIIYFPAQDGGSTTKKFKSNSSDVFLDIKIGNQSAGRIIVQLRPDIVPKTAGKQKYTTFHNTTS